jgi:hypothetical protein
VSANRTDISDLYGIVARELILHRQVEGLNVRSLKVILTSVQVQALSAVNCRVLQFELLIETRSFGSNAPQATIIASRIYSKPTS